MSDGLQKMEPLEPWPEPPLTEIQSEGRKPMIAREEIYEIAKTNAVVRCCIDHFRVGRVSWEEAMMMAVADLAHACEQYRDHLFKIALRTAAPPILQEEPE